MDKVKGDEANFKAQSEIQMNEIEDLRKQLAEAKEKCALAEANREASEYWRNYLEKNSCKTSRIQRKILRKIPELHGENEG